MRVGACLVLAMLVACGESAREREERRLRREREVTSFIEQRLAAIAAEQAAPPPPVRHSHASAAGMVRIRSAPWIRRCGRRSRECSAGPGPALDDFFIDVLETTVAEYDECVQAGGCVPPVPRPEYGCAPADMTWPAHRSLPVNCVSAHDAFRYCTFRGKRLPMFDEWDRAAHGVDGRAYPWGDARPSCTRTVGWGRRCQHTLPLEGGSRHDDRSPDGVLDMGGNVAEYVADPVVELRDETGTPVAWLDADRAYLPRARGGSFLDALDARQLHPDRAGFSPWEFGYTLDLDGAFHSPAVGVRCVVNACPATAPEPGSKRRYILEPCVPVADAPP